MIYLFRVILPIIAIYIGYLWKFRFFAGMLPIWVSLFIVCGLLSMRSVYEKVFDSRLLKTGFISLFVVFLIILGLIIYSGFATSLNEEVDYVIVLGAGVRGETMSLTLQRRVNVCYSYLEKHPKAKAILSGGQGPGEDITEAEAMRRYLEGKGIEKERLLIEDQSTSTFENIQYSFRLLEEKGEEEARVALISSRFHLFRGQIIAKAQGYHVLGIGSSTVLYLIPNYYLREVFGVIYEFANFFL